MVCKVASRGGVFGRFFQFQSAPKQERLEQLAVCQDLVQSLDVSAGPSVSTERVRFCLHAVTAALDAPASTSFERNEVIRCLLDADLPVKLLEALPRLEFEAAKDSMRLFHQILKIGTTPVFDYISCHKQILRMLLDGCSNEDVALQSNEMLRSCAKHDQLVEMMLDADFATGLIELVQQSNFDISSDAFCSLRELLLGCKPVVATYISGNVHGFFGAYHKMILSDDYFVKRQALCLLADVLCDPLFQQVAALYASEDKFLKIHMNTLRDNSKAIKSDAFRAFSVFVDDPAASPRVHLILFKNKERLVRLLEAMAEEAEDSVVEDLRKSAQALEALPQPLRRSRTASSDTSDSSQTSLESSPRNEQVSAEITLQQAVLNEYAMNVIQWHSLF